jgi:hypothetical protein
MTEATVPDSAMLTPVHQQLEDRQLLPGEHLAGSGYPSAELIIHAARVFGITLVSPMLLDTSAQARAGAGYDKASFAIDFDARQATCSQGITSSTWNPCRQRHDQAIVVSRRFDGSSPATRSTSPSKLSVPFHPPSAKAVDGTRTLLVMSCLPQRD